MKGVKLLLTLVTLAGVTSVNAKTYATSDSEINCLSIMSYVEARGTDKGVKHVIDVMFNRLKDKRYPNTVCGNLYLKKQYPWVKNGRIQIKEKKRYEEIKKIAREEYVKYLLGDWRDSTKGAMYFNALGTKPYKKSKFLFKANRHYFYI